MWWPSKPYPSRKPSPPRLAPKLLQSFTTDAVEIGAFGQCIRTRSASAANAQSPASPFVKAAFGLPFPNELYRAVAGVAGPAVSKSTSSAASAVKRCPECLAHYHVEAASSSYLRPYGDSRISLREGLLSLHEPHFLSVLLFLRDPSAATSSRVH